MEAIDDFLFNLDFNNINKTIDVYLKQLYSKYDSLQSYTLLIGSKGDTIQKNKSFIEELSSIMIPISTIYSIIEHSLNYQFVHKNEKVECRYKLKPKVKETNLYIDKLCTLFDDILQQNKHFVKNVNKLLDKSQNSTELLSIKESINELILK